MSGRAGVAGDVSSHGSIPNFPKQLVRGRAAKDVAEKLVDGLSHPVGPGLAQSAGHDHTFTGAAQAHDVAVPRSQEVAEPISAPAVINAGPVPQLAGLRAYSISCLHETSGTLKWEATRCAQGSLVRPEPTTTARGAHKADHRNKEGVSGPRYARRERRPRAHGQPGPGGERRAAGLWSSRLSLWRWARPDGPSASAPVRLLATLGLLAGGLGAATAALVAGAPPSGAATPSPSCASGTCTVTFPKTGAAASWTVPDGLSALSVILYGADGGAGDATPLGSGEGGSGAEVKASVALSAGTALSVNVGGTVGINAGGYNGGGVGNEDSGGGGGATDLSAGATSLLVAGGGGGGGVFGSNSDAETVNGGHGGNAGGRRVWR